MDCCKILVLFISIGLSCALDLACRTEPDFASACKFRNLTLVTYTGFSVPPDMCDSNINITDLSQQPTLYINTKNASDVFTVLMLDAGPYGTGPYYLHWLLSNLTSQQLAQKTFSSRPSNIPAYYQPPSLPKNAGIHQLQIVAFRHNTTLKVPFPEVYDVERRAFSIRHWLDDVYHKVKLCGPVAGIQIRTQYQEPTGASSIPYVPPGVAPGMYPPSYPVPAGYPPSNNPNQPYPNPHPNYPQSPPAYVPNNQQTPPKKKGNASLAKPASIIILSLVIFASALI